MFQMSRAEFERAVDDALADVPDDFAQLLVNTVIIVEDDAPEDDPDLLGLYDGIALTEQYGGMEFGQLPNVIYIFRNPTLRICDTRDDVLDEVYITVMHEIAHHFGIDDERLHELGWE
ncbi:MAG: metallopeptidase family protein [Propionibacteriaceae bacterium]|jgi:predicted Zn-dependent protease with MMP-like domain|nr:metallopeptidase family protein [Propionibacteriaceae bacterium]